MPTHQPQPGIACEPQRGRARRATESLGADFSPRPSGTLAASWRAGHEVPVRLPTALVNSLFAGNAAVPGGVPERSSKNPQAARASRHPLSPLCSSPILRHPSTPPAPPTLHQHIAQHPTPFHPMHRHSPSLVLPPHPPHPSPSLNITLASLPHITIITITHLDPTLPPVLSPTRNPSSPSLLTLTRCPSTRR
ncbi:hypothetical protein PAPYR_12998 [Paratrimastix pyriformis]|uniref:Uncharacterized protein n=1 Tax=Paratrimastix pyriformis TaxID=342808 RepID=A0ABQ8U378_9EUKA|nr:hypothetical protein PAPYR_12998 [Paratrimastix pyriformis]